MIPQSKIIDSQEPGSKIDVIDPFDGSRISTIAEAGPRKVNEAVNRARRAALEFRNSTPFERRSLLNRIAALIERDQEVLAATVCAEVGKTINEARREIARAQNTLRLSADAACFLDGEVLHCGIVEGGADRQAVVTYAPTGVVAAITPFNYPVNLLCHKLGPALGAGNAVLVKPSPKAPLAAEYVVNLCREAGAPAGLVEVVHGGADTAVALAQAEIDLLSFTGGPGAGLALKRASGLVRCLMELGGNDPLFVLPDADITAAAATAVAHRFEIAGQSCAAVKKLYLHEDIKSEFLDCLVDRVDGIKAGDPKDPESHMGPVIDAAAADEIESRLQDATKRGGRIVRGGTRDGNLVAPTVLDNVDAEAHLLKTETFGPILAIREFSSTASAIDEVNRSGFGLQAGVFSNDHAEIKRFARGLQVGGVMINEGPDFRAEHVPFGGVKKSGLGREGVRIAMREMSETKVVID